MFTFIEHPTFTKQIEALFYAYTKGDITDMNPDQKKRLAQAVEQIKKEHQK